MTQTLWCPLNALVVQCVNSYYTVNALRPRPFSMNYEFPKYFIFYSSFSIDTHEVCIFGLISCLCNSGTVIV